MVKEKVINVKIDEQLYWQLKKILIDEKITMKEGIERAINEYIFRIKTNL